ncbi:hypothetical protein ACQP3C_25640, partial [Escherichia coli]
WVFCISSIFFFWFFETGFLCVALEPILPGTRSGDKGWPHRDPPASASRVLGLKTCATNACFKHIFDSFFSFQKLSQQTHGSDWAWVTWRSVGAFLTGEFTTTTGCLFLWKP